jgi:hypothetical protein
MRVSPGSVDRLDCKYIVVPRVIGRYSLVQNSNTFYQTETQFIFGVCC